MGELATGGLVGGAVGGGSQVLWLWGRRGKVWEEEKLKVKGSDACERLNKSDFVGE